MNPLILFLPGPIKLSKMVITKISEDRSFHCRVPYLANFDQSWTSNIWGKIHCQFCYLPTTLYRLNLSLCWKKSQPKIHGKKKDHKVGDKTGYKKKGKGNKKGVKKNRNKLAKKSKFWRMRMCKKQKRCLITSN